MVLTDEKDLTVEIARNRKNDRVYGKRKKDISVKRLHHETWFKQYLLAYQVPILRHIPTFNRYTLYIKMAKSIVQ